MKFVLRQRLMTIFAAIGAFLLCKELYVYAGSVQFATEPFVQGGLVAHSRLVAPTSLPSVAVVEPFLEPALTVKPAERILAADSYSQEQDVLMKKMHKQDFLFDSTIRNCLGTKCFDERPAKSPVDRVGLLGTEASGVDQINDCLLELLGVKYADTDEHSTQSSDKDRREPVPRIIQSSHVPAYGYGKNHGWNRIVRVVRRPTYHAVDLLGKRGLLSAQNGGRAERLVSAQTRQLVRWQCRLSHVAAHTKMLTVHLEDVVERPAVEIEKIMTFAGVSLPDRPRFLETTSRLAIALKLSLLLQSEGKGDDAGMAAGAGESHGAGSSEAQYRHLGVALSALEEEMVGTKRLSDWPCRSFRKVDGVELLPLPPSYFAPNCTAPFVTCSVGVDKKGA